MQKVLTGTSLRRIIAAAVSAVITVICPISYVGPGGIAIRTEDVSAESGSDNADVLLDIDYDTNNPSLTEFDRGEMPTYSVLEGNGNKCFNIYPNYSNFGYWVITHSKHSGIQDFRKRHKIHNLFLLHIHNCVDIMQL